VFFSLSIRIEIKISCSYRKAEDVFMEKLEQGCKVTGHMSQVNHPNRKGHQPVADEILK